MSAASSEQSADSGHGSHLGDRGWWYADLSIITFLILLMGLEAMGKIRSKRWRRFLFGDSWWERRKKRKQRSR